MTKKGKSLALPLKTSSGDHGKGACGFEFQITHEDPFSHARTGIVRTAHGTFETPVFMPVATQGTVKSLTPQNLVELGAEIVLANAYHLYIRPGIDIIRPFGTLHRFMGWQRPILTDSGGFQVFSLNRLRQISEEGVRFHSHFDGREIFLTPEDVIEIQHALGSDIAMVFDECPPATEDESRIRKSMELTLRWAERARRWHDKLQASEREQGGSYQALFGIVQGGIFPHLRRESLRHTVALGFDGYALGGLCVGEAKDETLDVLDAVLPEMPRQKPRYLMGVGTPLDFLEAVERGADLFDCVNPTRYGRNGSAFTSTGLIVVRNGKYQRDERPIDERCSCYTCRNFSRAYLRHLINADEMLGPHLLSLHNVSFFVNFVKTLRRHIGEGSFRAFKGDFINHFDPACR